MLETLQNNGLPITSANSRNTTPQQANTDVASATLHQQDFLTLMTAQLKNQDPLKPMENGDFLAQMAQFSTVSGIDRVNETLNSLAGGLRDMRIATARELLGQQVLVPGNLARPDANGVIEGAIDLSGPAQEVFITYSSTETGDVLHESTLGAQPAGLIGFSWPEAHSAQIGEDVPIKIQARITDDNGQLQDIGPSVYAKVLSARTGGDSSQDVMLEIQDYGTINTEDITAFR